MQNEKHVVFYSWVTDEARNLTNGQIVKEFATKGEAREWCARNNKFVVSHYSWAMLPNPHMPKATAENVFGTTKAVR